MSPNDSNGHGISLMTQRFADTMGKLNPASSSQHANVSRKPVTPATGSKVEHEMNTKTQVSGHESSKPTNRDRYENKPMPELPSEAAGPAVSPSRKPYIQPAIPLMNPATPPTKRAVTDPVGPRNYPIARKPSVSHLRKVFGHAKRPSRDEKQGAPAVPYTTRKAAIILGLPQQDEIQPSMTALGTTDLEQALTKHPSSDHLESHEAEGQHSFQRERSEIQSTVGSPLSRSLEAPAISISAEDGQTKSHDHVTLASSQNIGGSLSPKIATYGQVGDKASIHDQKLLRVESVQGIIEHTESAQHVDNGSGKQILNSGLQENHDQNPKLPGFANGLNGYKGIWENDPAVGYSLPPFSPDSKPIHNQGSAQNARHSIQNPEVSPSIYLEDTTRRSLPPDFSNRSSTLSQPFSASTASFQPSHSNISTFVNANSDLFFNRQLPSPNNLPPQLGSANSWARTSITNEPVSALLPPRWPHHATNSVPPPPPNQQDYQRPDVLVAGISQLDRTIHHHIDQAFNGVSRLIIEKHDRVLDQVLRNLDDMGDALAKNHKTIKNDLKGIHNGIHKLQTASTETSVRDNAAQDQFKAVESSIGRIERSLDDQIRHFRFVTSFSDDRQPRSLPSRRAESAHGSLAAGSNGQPTIHEGHERGDSKARDSKSSLRSHRSNTSNGRTVERKIANSEPGLYKFRGSPDLREHPAYAGIPHPPHGMVDQDGIPLFGAMAYGTQSLGDHGWYQQAYGSG